MKKGKKPLTSGGGGGAFRAFLHCTMSGQKFNRLNLKQAAQKYRELSVEEHAYYQNLGSGATVAWQHGFSAFGDRQRQRRLTSSAAGVADVAATTTIVSLPAGATSALIPLVTRQLHDELREIRAKLKRHHSHQREAKDKEDLQIMQYLGSSASTAPRIFEQHCSTLAHPHFCRDNATDDDGSSLHLGHVRWFPPATQIAAVSHQN